MNLAMVPALAAIAGSLVGAMGSATATWITARHQDRRNLLGQQIARREGLHSDFIGESAHLLVDALQRNASDLQKLLPLYALLSRVRLSSSRPVLQEAEKLKKNNYQQVSTTQSDSRPDRIAGGEWQRSVEAVQRHVSHRTRFTATIAVGLKE